MDNFNLVVLERTLETVTAVLPATENPGATACVGRIRRCLNAIAREPGISHLNKLRHLLFQLVTLTREERQHYVTARLEAILKDIGGRPATASML